VPSTSQGGPPLLFMAPQTNIVISPSLGVFRGQQTWHPAPSLRCMPHVPCSQISNGRFHPTDASIATEAARPLSGLVRFEAERSRTRHVRRLSTIASVASFSNTRTRVSHQTLTSASVAPEICVRHTKNTACHLGQNTRRGTGV
jgi:hypothetical protein